jgi:HD-GYP domain-containing protein (c-di-GMP phosphodiesterase class II)
LKNSEKIHIIFVYEVDYILPSSRILVSVRSRLSKGWVTVTNDKRTSQIAHMLGKTLEEDIVSLTGAILIPRGTCITIDHVNKVLNHSWYAMSDEENVELSRTVENAVQELDQIFDFARRKNEIPLQKVYQDILPAVLKVTSYPYIGKLLLGLGKLDNYTVAHSLAVSVLSTMIGRWLGLAEDKLVSLTIASTLHDIGKMKIPIGILNKPGKLSEVEFSYIKKHTIFGYELIQATPGTDYEHALVALEHHERMDGSGYPHGKIGAHISYFARIIAIADVFHAMGSKRVYRGPKPVYEVLDEMANGIFGEFDPTVLSVFLQRYMENLIGVQVLLSNGKNAVIRMVHRGTPLRPLVEHNGEFIDLAENHNIQILNLIF